MLGELKRLNAMCVSGDLPVTKISVDTALRALELGLEGNQPRQDALDLLFHRIADLITDELSTKYQGT